MLTAEFPCETPAVQFVMGTRCRTIVSGAMTDRKLAIIHIEADQVGVGVPTHTHEREDETFHILSGKVRFTLGAREVVACAGETIFGPRGVPHSWAVLEPASFVVSVTPSGLEEMFKNLDALGTAQSDKAKVDAVCRRYAIAFA